MINIILLRFPDDLTDEKIGKRIHFASAMHTLWGLNDGAI